MLNDVDSSKGKFVVNMSGKEYLNYSKYQDDKAKKFGRTLTRFFYNIRFFISAIILYGLGRIFINTAFPTPYMPVNYGSFMLNGIIIPYMLMYVVMVCIAVAWVVHGFGFIIIKR